MRVVFPWDFYVSANARLGYHGGRMKSRREYREKMEAARLWATNEVSGDVAEGPVKVEERIYMPDRRRRDIRNVGKLFEDALEGVAYEDDDQIRELVMIHCGVDREEPRVELTVEPIEVAASTKGG